MIIKLYFDYESEKNIKQESVLSYMLVDYLKEVLNNDIKLNDIHLWTNEVIKRITITLKNVPFDFYLSRQMIKRMEYKLNVINDFVAKFDSIYIMGE